MKHDYSILVLGAGAGGLVVAIGAAQAGKRVLLIDKGTWGGDCTNFGCIPSKTLIAASHAAHHLRHPQLWGLEGSVAGYHGQGALERTRRVVQHFREEEGPKGLAEHGVETLTGTASFADAHTVVVATPEGEQKRVTADQIIIATGSRPWLPPIPGLEEVDYYTNETIFNLQEIPPTLGIIGGGPIGCELAQAFQRLGSEVAIIQKHPRLLAREEECTRKVIEDRFREEGIHLFLNHHVLSVQEIEDVLEINLEDKGNGNHAKWPCTHLLVAAGRRPNLEKLKLEKAAIAYSPRGVFVDRYGRTSQKHIWAVGDITGKGPFTHMAEHAARRVVWNLLVPYWFWKKAPEPPLIPRVTYTDPEVASVGMSEQEAAEKYGKRKIAVYHLSLTEVDRAVTTGRTEGFVRIITKKWSSKILGAALIAPRGGEMLQEILTAMHHNIPLRKLGDVVHPYPAYSRGVRKAADLWLKETLLPSLKKLVGRR